ncbi:MAG: GGDEF domain-containing protein [Deltaproteobacteria bacterium]|nr:GGDEF domain-containing protein [Deltaproteobacteria bacterium]
MSGKRAEPSVEIPASFLTQIKSLGILLNQLAGQRSARDRLKAVLAGVTTACEAESLTLATTPETMGGLGDQTATECYLSETLRVVANSETARKIWDMADEQGPRSEGDTTYIATPSGAFTVTNHSGALAGDHTRVLLQLLIPLIEIEINHLRESNDVDRRFAAAQSQNALLAKLTAELATQRQLIAELAVIDQTTGLYNAHYLQRQLAQEIERYARYGHPLSLLIMEIDNLRSVGKQGSDQALAEHILRHVSSIARTSLRTVDIVGRWDEGSFGVLLPDTDEIGAQTAALRLKARIEESPVDIGSEKLPISASIGLAATTPNHRDAHTLVAAAEGALIVGRSGGRGQIHSGTGDFAVVDGLKTDIGNG